jgi:hypothetical protein
VEKVAEDWRKLHIEELHSIYSLQDIIRTIKSRRMRLMGHVARMEATRNASKESVGKPDGKKQLGRY